MLSEVLLVCELLLFITLAALTGGKPTSPSTNGQKKRPQVRKPAKYELNISCVSHFCNVSEHFGEDSIERCAVT